MTKIDNYFSNNFLCCLQLKLEKKYLSMILKVQESNLKFLFLMEKSILYAKITVSKTNCFKTEF